MRLRSERKQGFTMIEMLMVVAIIGILSALAVPAYIGQRRRTRVIGDARTNTDVLIMALENRRAENATYGPVGAYAWLANGTRPGNDILPNFIPQGASLMNYTVEIGTAGTTFNLVVTDPRLANAQVLTANQTGTITLDAAYNH